jgi:histidinol-phosphate/aromatic aminotransferase/cobyric acid decarboxylase-like protein
MSLETLERVHRHGATLFFDETYGDFAANEAPGLGWVHEGRRVLVFRSFLKSFGLASLRVGVIVGPRELLGGILPSVRFYGLDTLRLRTLTHVLRADPTYPPAGGRARSIDARPPDQGIPRALVVPPRFTRAMRTSC